MSWYMCGLCSLTEVLDVLICQHLNRRTLSLPTLLTRAEALKDDDAVGYGSRDEAQAVGELCPTRVVVEGDVRQAVTERGEEELAFS